MGLVNTIALDIEFLRDTADGRLFLRCACGEWWDITDRPHVNGTILAALDHYAAHAEERTEKSCLLNPSPHERHDWACSKPGCPGHVCTGGRRTEGEAG